MAWGALAAVALMLASAGCPHTPPPKDPICNGVHPRHIEPGCRLLV